MDPQAPICIVTGANAGIGKAAALQLAVRGATLVLACRNAARGEAARQEIVEVSGNPEVHLLSLDTSSLASVRTFCEAFQAQFDRLDVLINNAGNFDLAQKSPAMTEEGLETVFVTNYLGPWLLTQLLLPRLQASAPARIINVGSKGLMVYPFLRIELDNLDGSRRFSAQRAYYHSKLACLTHTVDLASQLAGTGVVANIVRVPAVQVDLARLGHMGPWMLWLYKLKRAQSITPTEMARTYVALALDEQWATVTGQYVDESQTSVGVSSAARDPAAAQALRQTSAEMTGVRLS